MEDQVKQRLENAMEQLGREMEAAQTSMPDGNYSIKIVMGVVTVEGGTSQRAASARPVAPATAEKSEG